MKKGSVTTGALALLIGAASCTTVEVTDLSVMSVELTKVSVGSTSMREGSTVRLLKIEISTPTDLRELARRSEFNIGGDGYLCDSPSRWIGGGYLYEHGEPVTPYGSDRPPVEGSHVYTMTLPLSRLEVREGPLASPAVDLQQHPSDVCISINGGNMVGRKFQSNVMRIPKEVITGVIAGRQS